MAPGEVCILSENILARACAYTQIKEQEIKIGETHRENKPHRGKYEAKELIRKRQKKGNLITTSEITEFYSNYRVQNYSKF